MNSALKRRPTRLPPDLEPHREILERLELDYIIRKTCWYFQVRRYRLYNRSRDTQTSSARQAAFYFMTINQDNNLKAIGDTCRRDHSTAIYARDTIEDLITVDSIWRKRIVRLGFKLINEYNENSDYRTSNGAAT